jgi:hypothetical protein
MIIPRLWWEEFVVLVDRHQWRWNIAVHAARSMIERGSTLRTCALRASGIKPAAHSAR